jgi:type II secretory pathway pseudopilin PulG
MQLASGKTETKAASASFRGWTLPEALVVIGLLAVVLLVGTLSVYRGRAAAMELACQDHMRAIHGQLQIYWTKNDRTYPADQAAFEQFLQDKAYFPEELRCGLDEAGELHYIYNYDPTADPGPEGITITCPVSGSGHGSL